MTYRARRPRQPRPARAPMGKHPIIVQACTAYESEQRRPQSHEDRFFLCYLGTWAAVRISFLKKRPRDARWLWQFSLSRFLPIVYCLFGTDRLKRRRLKHRARFSAWPSHRRNPPAQRTKRRRRRSESAGRERQFLQLLSRINQLPSVRPRICASGDAKEFYSLARTTDPGAKLIFHSRFIAGAMRTGGGFCACWPTPPGAAHRPPAPRRGGIVWLAPEAAQQLPGGRRPARVFQGLDPRRESLRAQSAQSS